MAKRSSRNSASASKDKCVFCEGPRATPVDEFLYHNSFVAWKGLAGNPSPKHTVSPKPLNNLKSWIAYLIDTEFRASNKAAVSKVGLGRMSTRTIAASLPSASKMKVAVKHWHDLRRKYVTANLNNPRSFASIASASDVLQAVSAIFRAANDFLSPGYQRNKRKIAKMLEAIPKQGFPYSVGPLGFMFLERLRLRSLGHTVERAPFYSLTLTPGHVTTLRQRTFSKRVGTLEDAQEDVQERRIEDSATFSTEFSREFEKSFERTTSWGIHQSMSAAVQIEIVELKGQTDGTYNVTDTLRNATREFSKVMEQVSRKVESSQKSTHKVVMSVATENTFEQESTRVFRNDDSVTKKYLFRKVFQILQASYERYGIRACWVAPIKDPSKELRDLVLTRDRYPAEWAAAEDKWREAPVPADVATLPETISDEIWGFYDGGIFGGSDDDLQSYTVPPGYELYSITTGTEGAGWSRVHDGVWQCPDGNTYPYPGQGATGDIIFYVHWGVDSTDDGYYIVTIVCRPAAAVREEYGERVAAWRLEQTQREFLKLLSPRYEEIISSIPETWPPMVVMRRIAKEYFGLPTSFDKVDFLQRVFDWENLGIVYDPPAYDPIAEPNLFQCIPTDPFNASWAKVMLPLRPGSEEEAISFLMAAGIIPSTASFREQVQYYMYQMRNVFEPLYARTWNPGVADRADIQSPKDIELTPIGADDWKHAFERGAKFEVLDRYVMTIPTDGVDIEEGKVFCETPTETAKATSKERVEQSKIVETLRKRVEDQTATVTASVTTAT